MISIIFIVLYIFFVKSIVYHNDNYSSRKIKISEVIIAGKYETADRLPESRVKARRKVIIHCLSVFFVADKVEVDIKVYDTSVS